MVGLGDLPGGSVTSQANGVSGDGSVVVGGANSSTGGEAYRWTEAEGMVGRGVPLGFSESSAEAISSDGKVVVGVAFAGISSEAFRWTETEGMTGLGHLP